LQLLKQRCFACGTSETRRWIKNYDASNNLLCESCYNYYIRRPPKQRTHAYREAIKQRQCSECSATVPNPNGKEQYWMKNKDKKDAWLCLSCYARLYLHPKNNQRRFWFKTRAVMAKQVPRTGVCNLCRAVINEVDAQIGKPCRKTSLHHEQYDPNDPKRHTIEVCNRCHGKITGEETARRHGYRTCHSCGSDKTDLVKGKYQSWHLMKDGTDNVLCTKCYRYWKSRGAFD